MSLPPWPKPRRGQRHADGRADVRRVLHFFAMVTLEISLRWRYSGMITLYIRGYLAMRIPLVAAALTSATTAFAGPTLETRLDQAIDSALAEKRIVGAVVLVAKDGEIVYHRAAGHADREAGGEMHEDAIFRLASVTKPFVTAAAMRLVEEGRLDLNAPVTRWLPEFRPA